MSNTDNSTIVTDPFHNCHEENKKKCLADIQKVRDNDPYYTALKWGSRNVGADGAKVLAEALGKNSSVTHIDLDTNGIGAYGAKAIAEALKKNSSVTNIDLWGNKLGADGAKVIAEALKKNSSVTKINLRYNDIGDAGAKEIAEALKKNSSVNDINLSTNAIGADGGMAIAEALAENLSVTYIYLYGNNISPTDEALIISKTASNQILNKHQEEVQTNKNELKEKRKKIRELDDPDGDNSEAYELLDEKIRVLRAKVKIYNTNNSSTTVCSTPPSTASIRRTCSAYDCTKKDVQGGLCKAHGARCRECGHSECNKPVKQKGLCSAHFAAMCKQHNDDWCTEKEFARLCLIFG